MFLTFCRSCCNIFAEQHLEHGTDQGLDKEQLGEKCKGEIEAHQSQPARYQSNNVEAVIIRVIDEGCDQAHGGTHQTNRGTDDRCFKNDRMCCTGVQYFAGELERAGTAHDVFQQIGKAEFDQDYRPYGQHMTEHVNTILHPDGFQYAGSFRIGRDQRRPVDHIQAVEHIGMDSDYNGKKSKDHSLKLISWHQYNLSLLA